VQSCLCIVVVSGRRQALMWAMYRAAPLVRRPRGAIMSRLVWMNGREMACSTARTARTGVEARGQSRWDQSFYRSIVGGDCLIMTLSGLFQRQTEQLLGI
jgi:hypothetical protein